MNATTRASVTTSADMPAEASVGDHAAIGDMGTAALVDRWGGLDWLCWPRFDDPPLFRRLIDPHQGGYWTLATSVPFSAQRRYVPDTNVVETIFDCADGTAVAYDFAVAPADNRGPEVVRMVEGRSGAVPFRSTLQPTPGFDPGRCRLQTVDREVHIDDRAVLATSHPHAIHISSGDVAVAVADTTVAAGDHLVFALTAPAVHDDAATAEAMIGRALRQREEPQRWWRRWLRTAALPEVASGAVARSALAVKLLYTPLRLRWSPHRPRRCPNASAGIATGTTGTAGSETTP